MSDSMTERVAELVATGFSAGAIAAQLGVTEEYVELTSHTEEFGDLLKEYIGEAHKRLSPEMQESEEVARENRLNALESLVQSKLLSHISSGLADTKEMMSVLKTIMDYRKGAPRINIQNNTTTNIDARQQMVKLELPKAALPDVPSVQVSGTNEIMSVNGESMAGLASKDVQALIEEKRAIRAKPAVGMAELEELFNESE